MCANRLPSELPEIKVFNVKHTGSWWLYRDVSVRSANALESCVRDAPSLQLATASRLQPRTRSSLRLFFPYLYYKTVLYPPQQLVHAWWVFSSAPVERLVLVLKHWSSPVLIILPLRPMWMLPWPLPAPPSPPTPPGEPWTPQREASSWKRYAPLTVTLLPPTIQ